ncbi:MAG: BAX inhibitor protein [Gammaproteobacteria bacterium]|nr:BAX inhibitor protein [Gammaproteobacteria bacterium]|tara:strand:+ start:1183 stop:1896 length:714 start_codon:yes stop_codon:yes gene_type:complete
MSVRHPLDVDPRPRVREAALPASGAAPVAADHPVLRDTYRLLSMTLLFSGAVAVGTAALGLPGPGLWLTLGGFFGLLALTSWLRNSIWGLAAVFALTGFMGYTLGPVLAAYLALANGPALVATAAGATGAAFFGLSFYARSAAAPDLSRFGPFLLVGVIVALVLGIAAVVFSLSALALAVSGLVVLLMCGLIAFETQNIVRGGETNYIMATVSLFVSVFNLFTALLHLLGFFGGDEG